MGLDAVDDRRLLAKPPGYLRPDQGVGPLDLMGYGLADVMEEGGPLDRPRIDPQLGGQHACYVARLHQVGQHILPVGSAVFEPPQEGGQLGVHPGDAHVQHGPFAGVAHRLVDLDLRLFVVLLDGSGMDAPVGDQLLEGDPGNLAPHRVE